MKRIDGRIPLVVIDAVENAGDVGGAAAQNALQTEAVLRGLDLLGVLAADRGDEIRVSQRALEEVHLAEELQLGDGEQVPGQHEKRKRVRGKDSLIADVVDGEDRGNSLERGVLVVQGAQENGNQRGLPVVAMEDVGHAEDLGGLQNGAAIQGEALGIVMIVAQRSAVESIAIVEGRIIDEVVTGRRGACRRRPRSRSGNGRQRER